MHIDEIIQEIPKDKLDSIFDEKQTYSFLVGAGASMDSPSNLPSAKMIVKTLLQTYAPPEEVESIINHPHLRYEQIVDVIQKGYDPDLKFLDYLELITEPNSIHIFLAQMILKMNYVMTTNFDYLIEYALQSYCVSTSPKPIITKEDFLKATKPSEYITRAVWPVYKLHGSKKDIFTNKDTSSSLITTLTALGKNKEEGKTFDIEPYKKPAIRAITKDSYLVIIGYSGSDDFDIGPFLREITDLKGLIWIDHSLGENKDDIKIQEITNQGINSKDSVQKHFKLLLEIKKRENIPIFTIKTNTKQFIENYLYQRLTKDKQMKILQDKKHPKEIESFDTWFTHKQISQTLIEKYKFISTLFTELGEIESAIRCYQKGLDLCTEQKDSVNKAYFINGLGIINVELGHQQKAMEYFNNSLSLVNAINDEYTKFRVLLNIGTSNYKIGNYQIAHTIFLQALNLKSQKISLFDRAQLLNALGIIYQIKGQNQDARKNYEEAVTISEQLGDLPNKATFLYNLATIESILGKTQNAQFLFGEAAQISEQLGDWRSYISCLIGIGSIFNTVGYIDRSIAIFNQVIQVTEKIDDLPGKSKALNFMGELYHKKGDYEKAILLLEKALKIEEKLGNPEKIATRKNNIGVMYRNLNKINVAKPLLLEALAITERLHNVSQLAMRYINVGSIYEAERDFTTALDYYNKALTTSLQTGDIAGQITARINISGSYTDLKRFEEAVENYKLTLAKAKDYGYVQQQAEILNNMAIILYRDLKRTQEAYNYMEQALKMYEKTGNFNRAVQTHSFLQIIKKALDKSNQLNPHTNI